MRWLRLCTAISKNSFLLQINDISWEKKSLVAVGIYVGKKKKQLLKGKSLVPALWSVQRFNPKVVEYDFSFVL